MKKSDYVLLSRPDLREPFYVSIWFGQGVIWGGHSIFCFLGLCISMFWPGMVLNQGQLSIVVSDSEPYLGSPFPPFCVGSCLCLWHIALKLHGCFVLFIVFVGVIIILNKRNMYAHNAALWSTSFDGRDRW